MFQAEVAFERENQLALVVALVAAAAEMLVAVAVAEVVVLDEHADAAVALVGTFGAETVEVQVATDERGL